MRRGNEQEDCSFSARPAGVVRKKLALTLHSEKSDGERVYRVIDNDAEPSAA